MTASVPKQDQKHARVLQKNPVLIRQYGQRRKNTFTWCVGGWRAGGRGGGQNLFKTADTDVWLSLCGSP